MLWIDSLLGDRIVLNEETWCGPFVAQGVYFLYGISSVFSYSTIRLIAQLMVNIIKVKAILLLRKSTYYSSSLFKEEGCQISEMKVMDHS